MSEQRKLSRRGLFGLAGAGLVGVGLGIGGDQVVGAITADASPDKARYDFYGTHQAGVSRRQLRTVYTSLLLMWHRRQHEPISSNFCATGQLQPPR